MAFLTKMVMAAGFAVAVSAGGGGGGSIYPEDHFEYSARLTAANFNQEVISAVDSGKTMFVRFIATEG